MIDREARDQMGFLLRRFARGRITEKQFEDALGLLSFSGQDRAFGAIFEEVSEIDSTTRPDVARWILFLQSDAEYLWPDLDSMIHPCYIIGAATVAFICNYVLHAPAVGWLLAIIGIMFGLRRTWREYKPGNQKVWPFHQQAEFEEAKRHPRLLAGRSRS